MHNIENEKLWVNGVIETANIFDLVLISDDLFSRAQFYYKLGSCENIDAEELSVNWLVDGNIVMTGENYIAWNNVPTVNQWAYNWAASELNLTII